MNEKNRLRREIKQLYKTIDRNELNRLSLALSNNLRTFLQSQSFKFSENFTFGAFAPMNDEVKWQLALDDFSDRSCFPGIANGDMAFFQTPISELELVKDFGFEILCPKKDAPIVVPDLLIVPGRAFSLNGDRLGRGKGFYDRYLHHYGGLKIGVCLEAQIVDNVPVDSHDQPVEFIVTEKRVICVSDIQIQEK